MIKKQGKTYILYSKDGKKVLGRHASRRDARRQEAAIEIAKQDAANNSNSARK